MAKIHLLDNNTIDKIAAGEVVERPASVVKELVENSIDAGATIITVEIKNGGLKLIRITDNGLGIEKDQIRNAFTSHATSKIESVDDLKALHTLGFRGEALSSISAVSRVELTTRVQTDLTGSHYVCEGGIEKSFEDVGAPVGTTFLIRDLFYNTLPRLKFLKSETTEGNYVADLIEHLALSRPDISFQFINNGNTKFSTSGRGDLREVIYRIFGKEIAENIREINSYDDELNMKLSGYLGLPSINRSNRASEIFYINSRYVKSNLLSKAVEEGYLEYLMQHKFPFCVINFEFDPDTVDVNVHPTKQEVRLSDEKNVYDSVVMLINKTLTSAEMIDSCVFEETQDVDNSKPIKNKIPELFEQKRIIDTASNNDESDVIIKTLPIISVKEDDTDSEDVFFIDSTTSDLSVNETVVTQIVPETVEPINNKKVEEYKQLNFLDNEQLLSTQARRQYKIVGQLFKTYWLIEYKDSMMILDQHAAHEKVMFERLMKYFSEKKDIPSQIISPPAILSVSNREMEVLRENIDRINELGFTIEEFGDHEIAIRSVPMDLYGSSPKEMIGEILADLIDLKKGGTPDSIRNRIATMACKAAVKGNNYITLSEVETLLDEMLTLDNPYNCPHGRPTVITMTKQEIEKRFHRIV